MAYDNNMSGALFKNKKKEAGDKKPDYNGQCEINGEEMWVAAWLKDGPKGKYMSLSFTPKEEAKPVAKKPSKPQRDDVDAMMDDDNLPPF